MWRKNATFLLLLTITSVLLSPGCATLTLGDRKQPVPVTSSPAGATIIVNGVRKGVTPLQIWLTRKTKDQVIRIECPGYNPFEIRMTRRYSVPHAILDAIFGGIVGSTVAGVWWLAHDETAPDSWVCIGTAIGGFLLIDVTTRTGYTLTPKDLTATLTKADGAPRVDTVIVDAEEFQNVKWIRVRRD
jgi:hypothetical protein